MLISKTLKIIKVIAASATLWLGLCTTGLSANQFDHAFNTDGHGIMGSASVTPLLSFKLSASRHLSNNGSLDLVATYTRLEWNTASNNIDYRESSADFNLSTHSLSNFDFSNMIRRQTNSSAAARLMDALIIDGALGFNVSW